MAQKRSPGNVRVDDRWRKRDGSPSARNGKGLRWAVRWADLQGKEKERSFARKEDARKYADELTAQLTRGEYVGREHGRSTVETTHSAWRATQVRVKPSTLATRDVTWRAHVAQRWATVQVGDISKVDVAQWVSDLVGAGARAPTVENALGVLRLVLEYAVDAGMIRANPCAGVKPPRRKPRKHGYLTSPQVEALAAAVEHGGPFIRLLAYTGIRWGEMAALRVEDIDVKRRRISISRSLTKAAGGRLVEGTPKTHEQRSVPYPAALDEDLAAAMDGKAPGDRLFTSPSGYALRGDSYRPRFFKPALVKVQAAAAEKGEDFPDITMHDLRHTAASLAVSAGANVKAVQRMLGHKSAAMTLDTYSDLFDDDLDEVAARMHELICSGMSAG